MLPANQERVEQAFDQVLSLTPPERDSWLAQLASDEPAIASEVQAYVAALGDAPDFLEEPPELDTTFCSDHGEPAGPTTPLPQQIGRYQLGRLLGSGGMGEVYEAHQEHPRRTVALKLLRRERASANMLRRFEYEIDLLARIRHTGIAQILDAGTYGPVGGEVPYYVMELIVDGRDLLQYARHASLSVRRKIELFLDVCNAVEAAHQHGVIHRDIKPANILVGANGVPKLIDFGVARADSERPAQESMHTAAGQMIGTLRYMSPEQCGAASDSVDLRTDVYSLGVVLYELLCDQPPYDLHNIPFTEFGRVIREQPPRPPSQLQRDLAGDLETIMLKALAKDPQARYRSVADLADDLHRYLRAEPIEARPPSALYRLRMFARRRQGLVLGSAALLAVVIASVAGLTQMYLQTSAALRDLTAAREAERAAEEELANLRGQLSNTLALRPPSRDAISIGEIVSATRESMLAASSTEQRSLLVRSALNTLARLERQLPKDAHTLTNLADTYRKVGDLQGSAWAADADEVQQSVRAYERAVELRRVLAERNQNDADSEARLIDEQMKLIDALRKIGAVDRSIALANEMVERAERLHEQEGSLESGMDLLWAYSTRSDASIPLPGAEVGLDDSLAALAVGNELENRFPNEVDVLRGMAWTHFRIGIWRARRVGDFAGGLADEEQAIRYHKAIAAARPADSWPWVGLMYAASCENQYLRQLGRAAEGEQRMRAYLQRAGELLDVHPNDGELLGLWWQGQVGLLSQSKTLDESLNIIEQALTRFAAHEDPLGSEQVRGHRLEALQYAAELSLEEDPHRSLTYARASREEAGTDNYRSERNLIRALWAAGEEKEARERARRFVLQWPNKVEVALPPALRQLPPHPPAAAPRD